MHTPENFSNSSDMANGIPLFHVFTFHEDIEGTDPKKRRLARQEEIARTINEVLTTGELTNSCDKLCQRLNEEAGAYFYLGHLYPLVDRYTDRDDEARELELYDCTCFFMIQADYLKNISLKGSPFDTGGVFNHKNPNDPKSKLGRHVLEKLVEPPYTDCGHYVKEHSAIELHAVLSYASGYVESFFTTAKDYVARMFQRGGGDVVIDKLILLQNDDSRNISFEVRCFEPIPLPSGKGNSSACFVIAEAIQKTRNFPRHLWGQAEFDKRKSKSPVKFAYRESLKRIDNIQ